MGKSVLAGVVLGLLMGCSADSEIRKKADFVCRHVSLQAPMLEGLPEGAKADEYLRKEDVQFLQGKEKEDAAGLAGAMKLALLPAMKAITEARAAVTTCEVLGLTQADGRATVKLKESAPRPASGDLGEGLDRLGEINKLETHAARVAKAKEWFASGTDRMVVEHSVVVVKTEAGWRVDLQLPEKAKEAADQRAREAKEAAAKREREARFESAVASAMQVMRDCGITRAREMIDEAAKLMPDSASLATARTLVDERAPGCIGGKWYRTSTTDPMTDDRNVTVMLNADNEIAGSYKSSRPVLVGRCAEKRLELFISTDVMLDDTYDVGIEARYRFGTAKAERVVFSRSTDHKGAFFHNTRIWLTTLGSKDDQVLAIELPIYGSAPSVAQFSLAGVEKAVAELKSACGG